MIVVESGLKYSDTLNGKSSNNLYFCVFCCPLKTLNPCKLLIYMGLMLVIVTAAGFKPATPTSVVWYSIQLSYAASIFL